MTSGRFRFDRFVLDPRDRKLVRDDMPVELNARYLDALALLVRERGRLVSKNRFLEEVWRGVPVTDEALTQCVRTLRKQLGDNATQPRFIETVTKHGYRIIAPVEELGHDAATVLKAVPPDRQSPRQISVRLCAAGTIGGGMAGLTGGLLYGFGASAATETGALSTLLVVVCLSVAIALLGAAGVSFGIAASVLAKGRFSLWTIVGGGLGGAFVGAVVKLVGLDAFTLLFGASPGNITGASEGALLGAAVGLGAWLAAFQHSRRRAVAIAAVAGGVAGAIIPLFGGRLMAGSLTLLSSRFPNSHLRLEPIWRLFGETGFGPHSQVMTGGLEGMLFAAGLVGAMRLLRRFPEKGG